MKREDFYNGRPIHEVQHWEVGFSRIVHLFFRSKADADAFIRGNKKLGCAYHHRVWGAAALNDLDMRFVDRRGNIPAHMRCVSSCYDSKPSRFG